MGSLIMEFMSVKLMTLPTHIGCAASAIIYPLGLILSGISLQFSSGTTAELGLFFSQFILCGMGVISFFPNQVKTVMWYREIGRPSVGAGMYGFLCGFWPMTFSYWGTTMVNNLKDIHVSFYYTAAVIFVVSLPGIFLMNSPNEVPLNSTAEVTNNDIERVDIETQESESESLLEPNVSQTEESSTLLITQSESKKAEPESNAGLTEADPSPLLSKGDFNRQPQVYIQSIVWFLTFLPGFAIKFTIAPLMSAVFGASLKLQLVSSFIFLGSYALARLLIGFIIGKCAKVNSVARVATFIIPLCFFLAGSIVKMGKTDKGWMWAFMVVVNVFVACSLGVEKVLISLISLANWGVHNMKNMIARALLFVSLAAIIGPLIIWAGLSKPGDIYLDQRLNTNEQQQIELEQSMGIALLSLGAVGVLAFFGHWLCFKPYTIST